MWLWLWLWWRWIARYELNYAKGTSPPCGHGKIFHQQTSIKLGCIKCGLNVVWKLKHSRNVKKCPIGVPIPRQISQSKDLYIFMHTINYQSYSLNNFSTKWGKQATKNVLGNNVLGKDIWCHCYRQQYIKRSTKTMIVVKCSIWPSCKAKKKGHR